MCGIAGILHFDGAAVDPAELRGMAAAMPHRGPDDEGAVLFNRSSDAMLQFSGAASPPQVRAAHPLLESATPREGFDLGLIHRRFSIIDLSPAGHQPMFDGGGRCCLVANGEIYNHVELRRMLAAGFRFHTGSDSEAILAAYDRWGDDAFGELLGMWAVALYDRSRRRLLLSRDRSGKMPLYWWRDANSLYFASEIKALLAVERIRRVAAVDEESIVPFLVGGYRDLDDRTFFAGIRSLPAASRVVVDEQFPAGVRSYWSVPERRATEGEISPQEAAEGIRERLRDAVRVRLRCDVPWAIELSGGLDSSVLVDLADEVSEGPVPTFTVRFADPEWDESPFAASVARRYGTDHTVIDPPAQVFWGEVAAFTRLMEEPYHSPAIHIAQLLRRTMREHGFKVLLTGAAGDELFAGYSGYFAPHQRDLLRRGELAAFVDNARHHTESSSAERGMRNLLFPAERAVRRAGKWGLQALGLFPRRDSGIRAPRNAMPSPPSRLTDLLRRDMTLTNMPYWLRSGNVMFMGIPVEARSPYLDHRLVEWVFRLPTSYLIRHGWHKWILRKAFAGRLPDDVVWRRRKLGFPFPIERFLRESAAEVDQVLAGHDNPFLDEGIQSRARTDWRLLSFILWHRSWFGGDEALQRIQEHHQAAHHVPGAGFLHAEEERTAVR